MQPRHLLQETKKATIGTTTPPKTTTTTTTITTYERLNQQQLPTQQSSPSAIRRKSADKIREKVTYFEEMINKRQQNQHHYNDQQQHQHLDYNNSNHQHQQEADAIFIIPIGDDDCSSSSHNNERQAMMNSHSKSASPPSSPGGTRKAKVMNRSLFNINRRLYSTVYVMKSKIAVLGTVILVFLIVVGTIMFTTRTLENDLNNTDKRAKINTHVNNNDLSTQEEEQVLIKKKCEWTKEPLYGPCDVTKSTDVSYLLTSAQQCEETCCDDPKCITFQYRTKDGCLFGIDARVGNEKDAHILGWCEPRKPSIWEGQWVRKELVNHQDGIIPATYHPVIGACTADGWKQHELTGQCFGLGAKRHNVLDNTPEACRDACCMDKQCNIWQWRIDSGCFYHTTGFGCQHPQNPIDYEPYYGKRKVQPGREYSPPAYSGDYDDMKIPDDV